ncbi:MAG TPA: hypothetical protein VJ464_26420 [Blastocatellia bacterium]|nr:hypothetical protein [Blastocatellia bacterium]
MNLAEKLASAVLNAQANMRQARALTIAELTKQRNELRRLGEMVIDSSQLQQQKLELDRSLNLVTLEIEKLIAERDKESAILKQELQTAWERLSKIYNTKLKENHAQQTVINFNDAIEAYAVDLEKLGIDVQQATPAQLRKQLPTLARIAALTRKKAEEIAGEASKRLEAGSALSQQYRALQEEQFQIEQQWNELRQALRQHYRSGETGIMADLETMDKSTAKRLRQEILAPQLNDARIEREKGLTNADPLKELDSLTSHS